MAWMNFQILRPLVGSLAFSIINLLAFSINPVQGQQTSPLFVPPIDWTYEGLAGPKHWEDLFEQCGGTRQSPLAINTKAALRLPIPPVDDPARPVPFYNPVKHLEVVHSPHTVLLNFSNGSYLKLFNQKWKLIQSHYHVPCEHTIDGECADAEVHFVHQNSNKRYLVVAVPLQLGERDNRIIQAILDVAPVEHGHGEKDVTHVIAPPALQPFIDTLNGDSGKKGYIVVEGSLTTPPCTEGVLWIIVQDKVHISSLQLKLMGFMVSKESHNNRPTFPSQGREMKWYSNWNPDERGHDCESMYPIDLKNFEPPLTPRDLVSLPLRVEEAGFSASNEGNILHFHPHQGSVVMRLDNQEWELVDIHGHAATRPLHVVADKAAPLEWHLVFQNKEGQQTILVLFMDVGEGVRNNEGLEDLMRAIRPGGQKGLVNLTEVFFKNRVSDIQVFNYEEYNTVFAYRHRERIEEPCDASHSDIDWFFIKKRLLIPPAELEMYKKLTDWVNSFPIQRPSAQVKNP